MGRIKVSSARNKGRMGESDIRDMLQSIVNEVYRGRGAPPPELSRGPHGKDIVGLPWLAPEVKRHEPTQGYAEPTLQQVKVWWEQCKSQAKAGQDPVLFFRANHQPWRVRMFGYISAGKAERIRTPVDISIDAFFVWFKTRVESLFA